MYFKYSDFNAKLIIYTRNFIDGIFTSKNGVIAM